MNAKRSIMLTVQVTGKQFECAMRKNVQKGICELFANRGAVRG
jgi:hypothetical protein